MPRPPHPPSHFFEQTVFQGQIGDNLLERGRLTPQILDPFSFQQDGLTAPEVDVGRGEIVDALVIAPVVVVRDGAGRALHRCRALLRVGSLAWAP
jgi:hypothetical protein